MIAPYWGNRSKRPSVGLAVARRVSTYEEAIVMASALRSAGISAEVFDNLGQMGWTLQTALGGFRVVVSAGDLDEARDFLDAPPTLIEAVQFGHITQMNYQAQLRIWKLTKASVLAVVASCVGGGAALGVLTPDGTYMNPMWWIAATGWWAIVSTPFAMTMALPAIILLSVILNKLTLNGIIYYIFFVIFISIILIFFEKLGLLIENSSYY